MAASSGPGGGAPPDGLARWISSRPRAAPVLLFLAVLTLYHANGEPISSIDTVTAPYVAWQLARGEGLDLAGVEALDRHRRALVETPAGLVSRYPPGRALAALPVVAPVAWLRDGLPGTAAMRRLGKLAGALATAGAVALFAGVCAALAPAATAPATLLFALGTSAWSTASQSAWAHGPALLGLCAAGRCLLLGAGTSRAGAAGLCVGLATLSRPTAVLFVATLGAALAAAGRTRETAALALGAALPVLGLLAWNQVLFQAPLAGGYGDEAGRWSTPLGFGAAALLVSPARGLLFYSPALALAPLGLAPRATRSLAHRERVVLAGFAAGALLTWLLYARWHAWHGGWCYGPRFLTEALPALGWLFALAAQAFASSSSRRRGLWGAVALGVGIHAVGVLGSDSDWSARHPGVSDPFDLRDTQIAAHARAAGGRIAHVLGLAP